MNARFVASLGLAFTFAACEQQSQTLPFSADLEETVVRTISADESGSVTSAAGAAVRFPAGSLSEDTEISIKPVAPPAGIAGSGAPVSRGFQVEPAGLALARPALAELRIDPNIESARAWLASVVVVTADGFEEIGSTRLDLRAGLAEAPISRLGTLAVVIPEPRAVFVTRSDEQASSLSAAPSNLLPIGTDSVVVDCGRRTTRCDGLSVSASVSLNDKVAQTAAVYPRVFGSLVIDGVGASGEIVVGSSVRLLLRSGATSENVEVQGLLRPTAATVVTEDASSITLTNVYFRVGGGAEEAPSEGTRTLVIQKGVDAGFATFSRTFQLRNESDQLEDASVAITFPVQIHQ
jgi:hypothetical protein